MPAEEVLIFDGLRGILTMVVNADATRDNAYEAALARLDDIGAARVRACLRWMRCAPHYPQAP